MTGRAVTGAYQLDHKPSKPMRRLLWRLADGNQIARFPDGTYRVRQTDEVIQEATLRACLRRQWITDMPGLPLFEPDACWITPRGVAAIGRHEHG